MNIPAEFDDIRPFEPEELPAAYDRLLSDSQFQAVIKYLYPDVPFEAVAAKMKQCKTSMEFQLAFCYSFLKQLLAKKSSGYDFDFSSISNQRCYTFMSNHRDIVLDSALLDFMLVLAKFSTTCEIAIGDNLLSLPWVRDLVRINKSFIVKRSLSPREMLVASAELSRYMHFSIGEKHQNLWIAQREGRAKDSNDRTQKGIIKMLTLGGEGSAIDRLQQLHIVPLAISYEYDPCDYLKAAEFQLRRDVPDWKKGPMDDVVSMRTGITGYKGHIHYHSAPCIDDFLEQMRGSDINNNELFERVCHHIDRQIHLHYQLYPDNFVALDMLKGSSAYTDRYTDADKASFVEYLQSQLSKIDIPNKDEAYLRERMLTMYAYPAINQLQAQQES